MYAEDINKYLRDLTHHLNKQKKEHIHIHSSLESTNDTNSVSIHLNNPLEDTIDIRIIIPSDRTRPATISMTSSEIDSDIDSHIGNSRNVSLEHDLNLISQVISESINHKNPITYVIDKLTEIFTQQKKTKKIFKSSKEDEDVTQVILSKDKIDDIIAQANFKGANILSWHKTPNDKVVLVYKDKDDENYGSEFETNVHLYYAYLLKNKNPSKRVF